MPRTLRRVNTSSGHLERFRSLWRADGAKSRRSLLRRLGITLIEFYWFDESISADNLSSGESLPEGFTWGRITAADLPEIKALGAPPSEVDPMIVEGAFARGDIGFCIRRGAELVAISCCALDATHVWLHPITLKANEAYFHHLYVRPDCRGRGLAGLLRRHAVDELRRIGRDHCYSITLATNSPSLRVKEKIGMRVIFRAAAIRIGSIEWRWVMRRYPA